MGSRVLVGFVALMLLLSLAACGTGTTGTASSATPQAADTAAASEGAFDVTEGTDDSATTDDVVGGGEVVVERAGFTYENEYDEVGYGAVLKNSGSDDATDVEVIFDFVDKSGTVLASDTAYINVIPAGATYYFGSSTYCEDGKPRDVETEATVGSWESAAYELPKVSGVKVKTDDWGDMSVVGVVTNPYDESLSSVAHIGIVLMDSKGRVVGGGFTYLDNRLRPGRSARFESTNGVSVTPKSRVATVGVSVNNEVE